MSQPPQPDGSLSDDPVQDDQEVAIPEVLNMDEIKIDPSCALRIPANIALRRQVLPFVNLKGQVYVACHNPNDESTLRSIKRFYSDPLLPLQAEPVALKRAISTIFGGIDPSRGNVPIIGSARGGDDENAAADLCLEIVSAAVMRQTSDIHIDPDKEGVRVRFRVDGQLETFIEIPLNSYGGLVNRIKVLSGLDIAEKRIPQDGAFTQQFPITKTEADIRVATIPTKFGEKITMRILMGHSSSITLGGLGMGPGHLELFETNLNQPHGMILITGPTGSGKSTTLYSSLSHILGRKSVNIITIEDPIEYNVEGVVQVQVDPSDKVSFGRALKSVLRHDPDVVMIGEIRDADTAGIAIKASLTGHLVFSTLHTNSAPGVITRLTDMGVEPYLVASTLRLAMAQRLARKLCQRSKRAVKLGPREAAVLGDLSYEGRTVYEPQGSIYNANRGFVGRVGLFEVLPVSEDWAHRIAEGVNEGEIINLMREQQLPQLADDAREKVFQGLTSVGEVMPLMLGNA